MIKNFKYLIGIILTVSIFQFSPLFAATSWDTTSWVFTTGSSGNGGTSAPDPTPAQTIEGYVRQINTLTLAANASAIKVGAAATEETPDTNFGQIVAGTPIDKLVMVTDISNNNPMGFSVKVHSSGSCKLIRKYYNGTIWTTHAVNTGGNYAIGNTIDYKFSTKLLTATANGVSVVYGLYPDSTSSTIKQQTELVGLDKEQGGTAKSLVELSAGDAQEHVFSHQHNDGTLNVHHATKGYRIAWYISANPTDSLLRGFYSDTITITLLDGDAT